MKSAPATISPTTIHGGMSPSPATESPNASPATPAPASTMPVRSKRSRSSTRTSSMYFVASTMPISPIGTLIRKIQCQLA